MLTSLRVLLLAGSSCAQTQHSLQQHPALVCPRLVDVFSVSFVRETPPFHLTVQASGAVVD